MAEQAGRLAYYHGFAGAANEPAVRLAARLLSSRPCRWRASSSRAQARANDTQLKLIWLYNNLRGKPAKKKIIARGALHGSTVAAASLTRPAVRSRGLRPAAARLPARGPAPGASTRRRASEDAYAARLARELGDEIVRQGARRRRGVLRQAGDGRGRRAGSARQLLRADRAGAAPPRRAARRGQSDLRLRPLGRWFGSQRFGIAPDLVTVAKGLTSGYAPLSACLVSAPIVDVLRDARARSATATPIQVTRSPPRGASRTSTSSRAGPRRRARAHRRAAAARAAQALRGSRAAARRARRGDDRRRSSRTTPRTPSACRRCCSPMA